MWSPMATVGTADTLELGEDITGDYLVPVRSLEEVARLVSGGDEVKIAASQNRFLFKLKISW